MYSTKFYAEEDVESFKKKYPFWNQYFFEIEAEFRGPFRNRPAHPFS
jgi:hypothetical protein